MSGGFLGSMFGVGVADQAHAGRMAEMDNDHRDAMNAIQAQEARDNETGAALREHLRERDKETREMGTRELIQNEGKETRDWVNNVQKNVNTVHEHIDDQSNSLKKFMGEQNESQNAAIQEVLTVVHELTDKVDHLQTEIDELKRERA